MNAILKPILVDTPVKISSEVLCACVQKASESWMSAMSVKILTNAPTTLIFAGQVVGVLIVVEDIFANAQEDTSHLPTKKNV